MPTLTHYIVSTGRSSKIKTTRGLASQAGSLFCLFVPRQRGLKHLLRAANKQQIKAPRPCLPLSLSLYPSTMSSSRRIATHIRLRGHQSSDGHHRPDALTISGKSIAVLDSAKAKRTTWK